MINIKIGKVTVRFDETIEDSVEPQYIGMPNEVAEVVETLSYSGGKYGNIFNPRNCFTVDLVIGIRNAALLNQGMRIKI